MEKQKEKNTKESIASESDAIREGKIYAEQLLLEIEPLLKEYFIGGFEVKENAIQMNFLNGQKFRLTVEDV